MTVRLNSLARVLPRAAAFVVAAGRCAAPLTRGRSAQAPAAQSPKSIQAADATSRPRAKSRRAAARKRDQARGAGQSGEAKQRLLQDRAGRGRAGGDGRRHRLRPLLGEPRPHSARRRNSRSYRGCEDEMHRTSFRPRAAPSLLVATAAQAQTPIGTVEGTVTDEQGAVLPGANVTLTGPRGAPDGRRPTRRGRFRFVGVPPGRPTA